MPGKKDYNTWYIERIITGDTKYNWYNDTASKCGVGILTKV